MEAKEKLKSKSVRKNIINIRLRQSNIKNVPEVQMPTNGREKLFRNTVWEIFREGKKELHLKTEKTHCLMDELIKALSTLKHTLL